ncbi:hypothetical protein [Paucibacter sp. M5-1]|uniref:hypothetical protein n=1 Tax=Paucibacter sp. M5-1 TaxID=3015998 RepID=UPI0022B8BCEC|nr:hypothetical protein [Paucibacter sp. M5-1]MCZ7880126.1 hypothetical protein [Paucibacter sp. M5-1]
MILTVVLFAIGVFRAFTSDTPLSDLIARAWVAPTFGIGLTLLLSVIHWFSPLTVDSGPRGIVRSKGDALGLVPWRSIRSYRIYELEGERVLELSVTYSTELERFYLAEKVDATAILQELRTNVPVEAQPVIAADTSVAR